MTAKHTGVFLAIIVALAVAGCTTAQDRKDHSDRQAQLVEDTPLWFHDRWRRYLERAGERRYAAMALDRKGRGWGNAYCVGRNCNKSVLPQTRATNEVKFRNLALKYCRTNVLKDNPAATPDCAIFASGNEIVWQGPIPRLDCGTYEGPLVNVTPAPSHISFEQWTFTLKWEGSADGFEGSTDIVKGRRSGRIAAVIEGRDCIGWFWFNKGELYS